MNEIVCVHKAHVRHAQAVGETMEIIYGCDRCGTSWKTPEPEPRVVISRIEDAKS